MSKAIPHIDRYMTPGPHSIGQEQTAGAGAQAHARAPHPPPAGAARRQARRRSSRIATSTSSRRCATSIPEKVTVEEAMSPDRVHRLAQGPARRGGARDGRSTSTAARWSRTTARSSASSPPSTPCAPSPICWRRAAPADRRDGRRRRVCYPAAPMTDFRRFRGTDRYLTNEALEAAVNCALALERPLLVKGEPGTGKTLLAEADRRGARRCSSSPGTSRARRARRTASTSTTPCSASTTRASATATCGHPPLHQARPARARRSRPSSAWCCSSTRSTRPTSSSPTICCTSSTACASASPRPATRSSRSERPVVIITSNNEKELPDAFLRRCVFHFIDFPEPRRSCGASSAVHHPELDERRWSSRRSTSSSRSATCTRLRKRPSTSELIDWIAVLKRAGVAEREARRAAALPRRAAQEGAGPGGASPTSSPAARSYRALSAMFVDFLYELRERKVPVGTQEAVALAQRARSAACTTARSTASTTWRARSCVHSEAHLDDFDVAFAAHFQGVARRGQEARRGAARLAQGPDRDARALATRSATRSRRSTSRRCSRRFEERLRSRRSGTTAATTGSAPAAPRRSARGGANPQGIRVGPGGGGKRRRDADRGRAQVPAVPQRPGARHPPDRGRAAQAARLRPRGRRPTSSTSTAPSTRPRRTPASSRSSRARRAGRTRA